MEEDFDFVVVGGGIEGSATAYQLAKRGKKTLLIEQFTRGISQGSSQGKSRIIRHSYKKEYFVRMMTEAFQDWFQIEKESNTNIFKKTGLLTVDKPPNNNLKAVSAALKVNNQPFEFLESEVLKSRFPQLNYPDYNAVYEADAGILKADIALKALQDLFTKTGGHIKDNTKVICIEPKENEIIIHTSAEIYFAKSVVICAGPWTNDLLKTLDLTLPLKPTRVKLHYWKETVNGTYNSDLCPTIIDFTPNFYFMPSLEYPGHVKATMAASMIDNYSTSGMETLSNYVKQHFPGLDSTAPSIEEGCFTTYTPDNIFVLDSHPEYKNIIIGAGFSGTGFKLAPVVGKILANLGDGTTQTYDLTPFRINRLNIKKN